MMDYKRLVSRILMLAITFAAGWLLVFIVACYIGSTAPTAPTVIVSPPPHDIPNFKSILPQSQIQSA